MNGSLRIPVLLAHAQPLVQAGLTATLAHAADIDLQLQSSPLDTSALTAARVLVLDIGDGLRLAQQRQQRPQGDRGAAILVIAPQAGEWEIRRAVGLGVQGLHLTTTPLARLLAVVRTLAAGGRSFDDGVAERLADSLLLPPLTDREREVLALLSEGACNKAVARQLCIALGTVKAHVRTLLEKLHVESRMQATIVARARGLVGQPLAAATGGEPC